MGLADTWMRTEGQKQKQKQMRGKIVHVRIGQAVYNTKWERRRSQKGQDRDPIKSAGSVKGHDTRSERLWWDTSRGCWPDHYGVRYRGPRARVNGDGIGLDLYQRDPP